MTEPSTPRLPADRWFTFSAGDAGAWRIETVTAVRGPTLVAAARLDLLDDAEGTQQSCDTSWALRGVRSNERYTTRPEHDALVAAQAPLARPDATRAALIPIRKSAAWWAMSQDERREVFEARSSHVSGTMRYLPMIARRLFHCRDLPGEPFDFLTWFEFAPQHTALFDELVAMLRGTVEWTYVEREVDVRVSRA